MADSVLNPENVPEYLRPAALPGQPPSTTPVIPRLDSPSPAPGVPTPSTPTTSGTGISPGSPTSVSQTPGFSAISTINTVDYYKAKAVGLLNPSLTSQYTCEFNPPVPVLQFLRQREPFFPGSDYNIVSNKELVRLSCSEASLPGSSLMTNEINDDYTGVTERPSYRRQYDDRIDLTFYVDHEYRILNFFEGWISYCAGENSLNRVDDDNYFYRVNFPDQYQTPNMFITKFERTSVPIVGDDKYTNLRHYGPVLTYRFIRAYPISISSMPVSYESSQLLKCTVSFSYMRYTRQWRTSTAPPRPQTQPGGTPRPPGTPVPPTTVRNGDVDRDVLPPVFRGPGELGSGLA